MMELRKCPECGREDPVIGPRCLCGYAFPTPLPAHDAAGPGESKPRLWIALIPGLLTIVLVAGAAIPRWLQFNRVSGVITSGSKTTSDAAPRGRLECVDVYALTLKGSEFYVPENTPWRTRNAPREMSTVVEGMASNRCGKPLKNVQVRIKVRDDKGRGGSGWAKVGDLGAGQAKAFERAWMGRVTSYEVAEVR
jgi:hypothetical protein